MSSFTDLVDKTLNESVPKKKSQQLVNDIVDKAIDIDNKILSIEKNIM